MNIADLLHAYAQMPAHNNIALPAMRSGKLIARTKPAKMEQVWDEIAAFRPVQGWLCYQSRVAVFTDGNPARPDEQTGCILYGECVDANGQSLHIRQDGNGEWVVVNFSYQDGAEHLVDEVSLIAARNELGSLKYRRYWQLDPEYGVRQIAACFTGFVKE